MVDKQKDLVYKVLIHLQKKITLNKKSKKVFDEYVEYYKQENEKPKEDEKVNDNDPIVMYENYKSW